MNCPPAYHYPEHKQARSHLTMHYLPAGQQPKQYKLVVIRLCAIPPQLATGQKVSWPVVIRLCDIPKPDYIQNTNKLVVI